FPEDVLKEIAAFYQSEAGKTLLQKGPLAVRDVMRAAEIWQNGVARDLAQQVAETLAAAAGAKAPAPEGAQPDQDAAPADGKVPENCTAHSLTSCPALCSGCTIAPLSHRCRCRSYGRSMARPTMTMSCACWAVAWEVCGRHGLLRRSSSGVVLSWN